MFSDAFGLVILVGVVVALFKQNNSINSLKIKTHTLKREVERLKNFSQSSSIFQTSEPEVKEKVKVEPEVEAQSEATPQEEEKPQVWLDKEPVPQDNSSAKFKKMESELSSRWMIWLGGITLALGGGFFVKYSIDENLISPVVRVIMGLVFGLALAVLGEFIRQKRDKLAVIFDTPDYLPAAISAAGLFMAFAAVYSGYALYDLYPAIVAFVILAALSLASSVLAMAQGRFFAYLGLVAGLVVPALVSTGGGSAWTLFPYLLVIAGSCLWVARQKAWVDVAATGLTLSMLWAVLWIFTNWSAGDVVPVGVYLLLLGAANSFLLREGTPERATDPTVKGLLAKHRITFTSDLVMALCTILIVSIVRIEHYDNFALTLVTIALAAKAYAVYRNPEYDTGALIALFGVVFLLATWHLPTIANFQETFAVDENKKFIWTAILPPSIGLFVGVSVALALAIGGAIFTYLPKLFRKGVWASVGAAMPIAVLIIVYGRLNDYGTDLQFAITSGILAVVFAFATSHLAKNDWEQYKAPIAAYATGASTAVAFMLAMILEDAWLSFALAVELAALAYIWQQTRLVGLRYLAMAFALVVLARLFLNQEVLEYSADGPMPIINWLTYGYLLTGILFYYASKWFADEEAKDRLIPVLKAGSVLLFVGFTTLEIRVLFSQDNNLSSSFTAIEAALQTINWMAASAILMWREVKDKDALYGILRRIMTVVSVFGLLGAGINLNYEIYREVGDTIIFNLILLQFFIPASILAYKAWLAKSMEKKTSEKLYGGLAFLGYWAWITLEVKNYFIVSLTSDAPHAPEWEAYSYSLAWLLYAVALLFVGLKWSQDKLRVAGLFVLGVVVVKVFVFDMSNIEGLARALSFLGLGVGLIGIGYLYQRLQKSQKSQEIKGE